MEEQQIPAEKDTPLSSQVLEYYRNYSQSHHLPRYLCGEVANTTSTRERLQEPTEIEDYIEEVGPTARRPPLIGEDHINISVVPPTVIITDVNVDNRGQLSPTSSVTSNRKLEWDNGADIGYENCEVANRNLFRSSSLPALNTLERSIQKDFLRHSPDGRIAELPQTNIVNKSSDISTESRTKVPPIFSSTSSTTVIVNDEQNQSATSQSSSVDQYCKPRKDVCTSSSSSSVSVSHVLKTQNDQSVIYVPVLVHSPPLAESTPNISEKQSSSKGSVYYETPVVAHPRKPPRKNVILLTPYPLPNSKRRSTSFDNLKNLDETLEQRKECFQKYMTEKQRNLCITKPASAEYINRSIGMNVSIAVQTEDLDQEDSSSSEGSFKIVDCNSFEYLYGAVIEHERKLQDFQGQKPPEDEVQANSQEIVQDFIISNRLQHSKAKSNLTNVTNSTETNSSESKSAKISSKLSSNLITDVEKSVDLLTRLLKSKKYDEDTKKYYIRKIVRKIVDSKYVDDDKSTSTTTATDKTTNESNTSEVTEPSHRTQTNQLVYATRKIKSETNLQEIADIYPRLQRNRRFTLTNNEFFVVQNKGDDTSSDLFRPHSRYVFPSYTTTDYSSVEKMMPDELANRQSSSTSHSSWRDDKTASERHMESNKPVGEDSDELVGFAKRERQSQLNWISNEISHLSKLKHLLEKKEFKQQQPDGGDATQSTAVYVITTDKGERGGSKKPPCNCHHNRLNIPNVVSARRTPGHHHIKLQRCSHNQQEYKVKQLSCQRGRKVSGSSTSAAAAPTSSEEQRVQSYKAQVGKHYNYQGPSEQQQQEGVPLGAASIGVTCSLLPSRGTNFVAPEPAAKNGPKPSAHPEPNVVLPKSNSLSGSSSNASPKKRLTKVPIRSKNQLSNNLTAKEDSEGSRVASKAKLISSELYQNSDGPTTSVRRYVFEIPIVDLHTNQEASDKIKSNFGDVDKKDIGLGSLVQQHVDLEVRNVHLIPDNKDTNNGNKEVEMRQFKDNSSQVTATTTSLPPGKMPFHNKMASADIGPSSSREGIQGSSDVIEFGSMDHRTSFARAESPTLSLSAKSKSTSSSKNITTAKPRVSEKRTSLDNNGALKRNAGSQTASLETYMKKLLSEAIEKNYSSGPKFNSEVKSTTGSKRKVTSRSNVQEKSDPFSSSIKSGQGQARNNKDKEMLNNDVMSDGSLKRISIQSKTSSGTDMESTQYDGGSINLPRKRADNARTNAYQQKDSMVHPESLSDDRETSPRSSDLNQLTSTSRFAGDKENIIDDNISSAVFIPRGTPNLEKVLKMSQERSLERYRRLLAESGTLPDGKHNARNASSRIVGEAPSSGGPRSERRLQKVSEGDVSKERVLRSTEGNAVESVPQETSSSSSQSKTISDVSSPSTEDDGLRKICQCCRSNSISIENVLAETVHHHPLCQTCYQIHQHSLWRNHQPFYMFPNHTCNCYTLLKTQQIQAIKTTINQLQNLECTEPNAYCACPPHQKLPQQDNKCLSCNCPIVKSTYKKQQQRHHQRDDYVIKTGKSSPKRRSKDGGARKNRGISYTLKLEAATEESVADEQGENGTKIVGRYEEQIIVKVPKNGNATVVKGTIGVGKTEENNEADVEEEEKENYSGKTKNGTKRRDKVKDTKTLQEYLSTNRPAFIESAEERRKCLIELAYMREKRCQKYKQLLAMTNGVPMLPNHHHQTSPNRGLTIQRPRFFSTKEMKRLTAKNYKKLPEVQQRLFDNKERQLKKANRLLSDIFNKKLREKVLRGQPSLSTSVSVINLT